MDEILARQLTRQLKLLNFWIRLFGIMMLIGFIIIGILIYKVITFTHNVENKFTSLQQKTEQTLNVQKQVCDSSTFGNLLKKDTGACK